ncbi:MAG: hypothetical protein HRT68_12645 [Flavobacteriaceae bacterium]|nr:hypothetical protein [Flavobacteriaceae bacterium]
MKKLKVFFGITLMAALMVVGLSSFGNAKEASMGPTWVKKSCPAGMAGYRCVWDVPAWPDCPIAITGKYGVWNCVTRN